MADSASKYSAPNFSCFGCCLSWHATVRKSGLAEYFVCSCHFGFAAYLVSPSLMCCLFLATTVLVCFDFVLVLLGLGLLDLEGVTCIAILIAGAFFHLHISCLPSSLFVLRTETFLLKLFDLLFDIDQQSDELPHLLRR